MSPNRRHWKRKPKNRKCRGCSKMFDDQGCKWIHYCDLCYTTLPTDPAEHPDCCYKCLTQPLGYECPRKRCECPQHGSVTMAGRLT